MVGGNGDVGIFWNQIEQLFNHNIEILHRSNLPMTQIVHFFLIEESRALQLSPDHGILQVLEHSMDAVDPGPVFFRLPGQRIGIVRLAHV